MALLFEPLTVRGQTIRNRVVFAPIATEMATEGEAADGGGLATEEQAAHYGARAEGGVGTVIVEHAYVRADGRYSRRQLAADRRECIPGLKRIADAIHAGGARAVLQLSHCGPRRSIDSGTPPLGPSAVPYAPGAETPQPMEGRAKPIADAFANAAARAMQAGFDGVEIHGAHGFLLSSFVSPLTNQRDDRYGGDWVRRLALPSEVITTVRAAMSPEKFIFYRLGADDRREGGLTPEDAARAALNLQTIGVDVLDISGGLCGSGRPAGADPEVEGYFAYAAEAVRTFVEVPIVGVGGIRTGKGAEHLLQRGCMDLVAVGRALLRDARWCERARRCLG